jgi:hypothetical protein
MRDANPGGMRLGGVANEEHMQHCRRGGGGCDFEPCGGRPGQRLVRLVVQKHRGGAPRAGTGLLSDAAHLFPLLRRLLCRTRQLLLASRWYDAFGRRFCN